MRSRAQDGREMSTFVRPQDVRIAKPQASSSDLELGTVDRLARIGGNVKLTVTLPIGEPMSVQVSKLELDALGIGIGDRVVVDVTSSKVFVDDYAI